MNEYMRQRQAFINAGRPLPGKKKYKLRNVSLKTQAKKDAQAKERGEGDSDLDKWFEARRLEMTGKCMLCGGRTEKNNDDTYRNSIHHFLDKKPGLFPSVATHPDNFWEVCFWVNSCHTNIHNKTITWELLRDSAEWPLIVDKFKKVYPAIAPEEHKNIPELLLKEIQ